jgi:hypothetical protein
MLTTAQVAQRLRVNPSRVRQLAAELGVGTKFGRDWMFTDEDLAVLETRKRTPGPQRLSASLIDTATGFDEIGSYGVAKQLRRIALNQAANRITSGDDADDPLQIIK